MAQKALVGSIVLFTFGESDVANAKKGSIAVGDVRPAVVVRVWPKEFGEYDGYNLQVLTDGPNDGFPSGLYWATSRKLGDTAEPGHCHWQHS